MSWENCESQLKTQLETVTGLTSSVTKGDRLILNKGPAKAAIIVYERMEQVRETMGPIHAVNWFARIYLFVRYKDDTQVHDDARDLRDGIITRINNYPHLGDGTIVWDALIEEGNFEEFPVVFGSARYWTESLLCRMTEDLSPTYAE